MSYKPVIVQVTIGAAATQVTTYTNTMCKQIFFQNNSGHAVRVGSSAVTSTTGIALATGSPGGALTVSAPQSSLDLSDWWVVGTQNDVLDVVFVQ